MAWETPKTDWNSEDYYNFGDLNRVENNSQELATLISTYATTPTLTSLVTTRTNTRIEFYDDINRVENNILILKSATAEPIGWITPITNWASGQVFDYEDANRLESNLLNLYSMINNIIAEFEYCNGIICGQEFNLGGV